MNEQRRVIYAERRKILEGQDIQEVIWEMTEHTVEEMVGLYCPEGSEDWDMEGLIKRFQEMGMAASDLAINEELFPSLKVADVEERLLELAKEKYEAREEAFGAEVMRYLERIILLRMIDEKWIDHLHSMDRLREGIGLRAYGQKDPKIEYINEGYQMFQNLIQSIEEETVRLLYLVQVARDGQEPVGPKRRSPQVTKTNRDEDGGSGQTVRRAQDKVGRNDSCPCGSGKKYKKCCGTAA
ncbi:MAG: SEC-C metal-binding domain-containing protein, partial [Candidatus Xenobia bacterium]